MDAAHAIGEVYNRTKQLFEMQVSDANMTVRRKVLLLLTAG